MVDRDLRLPPLCTFKRQDLIEEMSINVMQASNACINLLSIAFLIHSCNVY